MRARKKRKVALVTAGPTRAYLDDVRYVSNYSSGELGYKICEELRKKNFAVIAVVGPTSFSFSKIPGVVTKEVETPEQMLREVKRAIVRFRPEVGIFSAAVLDFVPKKKLSGKVSSQRTSWKLTLVPTPKIVAVIAREFPEMIQIGFKLEVKAMSMPTLRKFGLRRMKEGKLSGLCLNFLSKVGIKRHEAFYFNSAGKIQKLLTKRAIAKAIAKEAEALIF
jgi:phosphopantothenoylcysteine synthetase/decarboxylase